MVSDVIRGRRGHEAVGRETNVSDIAKLDGWDLNLEQNLSLGWEIPG